MVSSAWFEPGGSSFDHGAKERAARHEGAGHHRREHGDKNRHGGENVTVPDEPEDKNQRQQRDEHPQIGGAQGAGADFSIHAGSRVTSGSNTNH
jgi:hypothetical protein